MKRSVKATQKHTAELCEELDALADARHGKRTLPTHSMECKPAPTVTSKELIRVHVEDL